MGISASLLSAGGVLIFDETEIEELARFIDGK
jgi:hypothetical protein